MRAYKAGISTNVTVTKGFLNEVMKKYTFKKEKCYFVAENII